MSTSVTFPRDRTVPVPALEGNTQISKSRAYSVIVHCLKYSSGFQWRPRKALPTEDDDGIKGAEDA